MIFSTDETARYARHFVLPDFGLIGQMNLKAARVIVIGAGGLGCPVLQYLAAAGIGHLGIVDFDTVSLSNLQRQILFSTADIGRKKVEVAKEKLLLLNPNTQISVFDTAISTENVANMVADFDIIVDCTDNFESRYLLNDTAVVLGKVLVYAAIHQFEGQVAVFNLCLNDEKRSGNYRDIYPEAPPPDTIPACTEGGILGVVAGVIGCLQANEVLKIAAKIGEPLANKVLIFDFLQTKMRVFSYKKADNEKA